MQGLALVFAKLVYLHWFSRRFVERYVLKTNVNTLISLKRSLVSARREVVNLGINSNPYKTYTFLNVWLQESMEPVSAWPQTLSRAQAKATDYFVDYIFDFGRDLPEPREEVPASTFKGPVF